jgi:hypothetical protein
MAIVKADVVYWYDMVTGSGTSEPDANGGAAGTLQGVGTTWTTTGPTGIDPDCLNVATGITNYRFDTGVSPASQVAFTVAQWVYHAADANLRWIFSQSGNTGHSVQMYKDASEHVVFRLNNLGVGNDFAITGTTSVSTSGWHLVIFQRDASGNAEGFVDGTSQGTATSTQTFMSAISHLGNASDMTGTDFSWNGKLSQSIWFNRDLTSAERASLYVSGAGITYANFFASTPSRLALLGVG